MDRLTRCLSLLVVLATTTERCAADTLLKVRYDVDILVANVQPSSGRPPSATEGRRTRTLYYRIAPGGRATVDVERLRSTGRDVNTAPRPGDADHPDEHTWEIPAPSRPKSKAWNAELPFTVLGTDIRRIKVTIYDLSKASDRLRHLMAVGWISGQTSPAHWFQRDWWVDRRGICSRIETRTINGRADTRGVNFVVEREVSRRFIQAK